MCGLAAALEAQSLFSEALAMFEAAWGIQVSVLGLKHQVTNSTALRSARIKSYQREYFRKALEMYTRSLALKQSIVPTPAPADGGSPTAGAGAGAAVVPGETLSMAITMNNIAAIHKATGNYDTALHFFSRVLAARCLLPVTLSN
jgi:tetratricopeptide (TPR) repeat protein